MPDFVDPVVLADLRHLGLALLIGFLIGFEREWSHRDEGHEEKFAGARTFTLVSLFGGMIGVLGLGTGFVITGMIVVAALTTAAYWRAATDGGHFGGTTEAAVFVTFLLGLAATSGHAFVAAVSGVVVAIVLSLKDEVQLAASRLTEREIHATLRFLALSILVLPFLPNEGYGPYGALNPREIWLMVVLISGLSFAGYWAMKLIGPQQGTLVTGIVGGLASSTATTLSLARLHQTGTTTALSASAGIVAANVVMMIRVGVLLIAVSPLVWIAVWPVLVVGILLGSAVCFALWRAADREEATESLLQVGNPMDIKPALVFAGLLALISLASRFGADKFGESGLYIIGLISGFADVDAITLAAGRQAALGSIVTMTAGETILIAVVANIVTKAVMAAMVGNKRLGYLVGGSFALIVLTGGAAYLLLRFLG